MQWRFGLMLVSTLAACGDDGVDPNSCLPDGFADGEGMVGSEPLGPFVRASQIEVTTRTGLTHALVFDEAPGACGEVAATGKKLVILFCEAPTERDYILVGPLAHRCPGDNLLGLVERDGAMDVASATSGTISITQAGTCMRGTYSVQLNTDLIEGAFDAVVCD